MAKVNLASYMKEQPVAAAAQSHKVGPFITISREYGCYGFSLGLLIQEVINEEIYAGKPWQVYNREILNRLATETNLETQLLEQQRHQPHSLVVDFFRSLSPERVPSGLEIRQRIVTIVRGLAVQGRAILVGQGGALATHDLPSGLSIRLEAPLEWRIRQIAFLEGMTVDQAAQEVQTREQEREWLRKLYEKKFPRKPVFNIVYDCSVFTLAQIAQQVVYAMRLKGFLNSPQ